MVNLVLIGVRAREVGNGMIKVLASPQVSTDGNFVSRPGVSPGERPAAELGVDTQSLSVSITSMLTDILESQSWRT